jgi:toxin-antitoxin system PIN domain toxin
MTTLLDGNVLIALVVSGHIHHGPAEKWFSASDASFATCPITQGTLLRFMLREGQTARAAQEFVAAIARDSRHEFWPDSIPFADVDVVGVVGHRQVTDAYLAQLARSRNGRLATFDHGLAHLHSDVAELVPTGS